MDSELNFFFKNPLNFEKPKLPFDSSSFGFLSLQNKELTGNTEIKPSVKNLKKNPKRFWYLNDYEIYYSNRKNRIMIRNYKTSIYYEFNLSSFILRCHSFLKQDDTVETLFSKMLNKYLEKNITSGNFLCDFFINEDNERLWISIKTATSEYLYDITTHFLVLCYNDETYEWFSLLDNKYVECYDFVFVSNKIQFKLLQSYIYQCMKSISHGTTD
jgi:hypothetical protein